MYEEAKQDFRLLFWQRFFFTCFFNRDVFRKEHLVLLQDELGVGGNIHQKLIGDDMPILEWALPKEKGLGFSRREGEKMFSEIENLHDDFIMSGQ